MVMNAGTPSHDDEDFDDFASAAGAALRRPASEAELARVRSARQRRRVTQVVAVAGVSAAFVVGGALVLANGQDESQRLVPAETSILTAPPVSIESTQPSPTTTATEASESAPATSVPSTDGPSAAADWIEEQLADGYDTAYLFPGDGTDARILGVTRNGSDQRGVVLRADDTVVPLPLTNGTQLVDYAVYGVGTTIGVIGDDGSSLTVWLLDDDGTWRSVDGLDYPSVSQRYHVFHSVDGSLYLASELWTNAGDGALDVPTDRRFTAVSPEGTATELPLPPDNVTIGPTTVYDDSLFVLSLDNGAGNQVPLESPWRFAPDVGEWEQIAAPDWMGDCLGGCTWFAPHEYGDADLEVPIGNAIAKLVPDGTLGLLSTDSLEWTRIADPPFSLQARRHLAANDRWLVSVPYDKERSGIEWGVYDVESNTWRTFDPLGGNALSVAETGMSGDVLVIRLESDGDAPAIAIDPATGEPRLANEAEFTAAFVDGGLDTVALDQLLNLLE
jgi:hypothetical protein